MNDTMHGSTPIEEQDQKRTNRMLNICFAEMPFCNYCGKFIKQLRTLILSNGDSYQLELKCHGLFWAHTVDSDLYYSKAGSSAVFSHIVFDQLGQPRYEGWPGPIAQPVQMIATKEANEIVYRIVPTVDATKIPPRAIDFAEE